MNLMNTCRSLPVALGMLALVGVQNSIQAKPTDEDVLGAVEEVTPIVDEAVQKLWDLSEVSLHEEESAAYLKGILTDHGFTLTSEGTSGVPTAFVAEYGSGTPKLGVMLEYDALPGLGNKAEPKMEPREDGVTSGHACGHNIIGAGALGAALALKDLMEADGIPGTLRVYGGASEETEGAKVYMARDGLFDDLDAMLHLHPLVVGSVMNVRTTAQSQMFVEFTGKTAHAGQSPWLGRSALDAVELFLHALNCMREHVKPTARLHYIIADGGTAPNIVPEKASVKLTFREESRADVEAGVAWIKQMAEGAALMTQTKAFAVDYYGMYDLLPNTPLAERMQEHYENVGIPDWTEEDQEFARALQKEAGVEAMGMTMSVEPLPDEPAMGGSTDVGDVSWITPTMGVLVPSIPEGLSVHTWMATASHGTDIATKAAVTSAKVLALAGADLLTEAEFRRSVREDFERRTEGFTYKSPLPDILKEPVGLPDPARRHGPIADIKETYVNSRADHEFVPHDHDHGR